jgi:transcriptional regulator with XRE-family HTH domain
MLNTITKAGPMTIADRVKQLRKEHGLTQEDLAAKAGLGVATIQRVERGEHPSAATIASIASAFALSSTALTSASKAATAEPAVGSYLPLVEIISGKRLVDLIAASSAIDFDYMEIEGETAPTCLDASTSSASRSTIPRCHRTPPNASVSTWRRRSFSRS